MNAAVEAAAARPRSDQLHQSPRTEPRRNFPLPGTLNLSPRARRHGVPRSARGAGLVLIVDDSVDVRQMYTQYFSFRGFSVLSAADGNTGIEVAIAMKPDIIVMDLSMPQLNGISATLRLRHHPRTRNIPVILLTGYPYKAIEQGALEAGADIFLTKPCLPEDLEGRVQELLRRPPSA